MSQSFPALDSLSDSSSVHSRTSWRRVTLLLAIAATIVISPMPFLGQASGHDIQFHIASWMETARQWHEGIFYPRWAEWANWGFGEPRFVFYPPLSWILGAALESVLPTQLVPGVFIWLTLVGAGLAAWKLAKEYLPEIPAICAAVLFAVNPYNLVIVYYRSDYAELLAIVFFPLLILGLLRVSNDRWRSVPLLAGSLAAIWLSNAPAGVIATYSFVLILAVVCSVRRTLAPVVPAITGMICGLGLAAFYILPAAWERRWVQIQDVEGGDLRFDHNFLFTHSHDADFQAFNWKVSYVAVAMIACAILGAAISFSKRKQSPALWWTCIALVACGSLLMTPASWLLWNDLPELHFIQFSWRWLGPLGLAFAFSAASSISASSNRAVRWFIPALALILIVVAGSKMVRDGWWDSCDSPFIAGEISSQHGYEGTDEYAPSGMDRSELPQTDPAAGPPARVEKMDANTGKIVAAMGTRIHFAKWTAEEKDFSVDTPTGITLAPHLVTYPAWHVRVDGKAVPIRAQEITSRILFDLPTGSHQVQILFVHTWDRITSDLISAAFGIGLLIFHRLRSKQSFAE